MSLLAPRIFRSLHDGQYSSNSSPRTIEGCKVITVERAKSTRKAQVVATIGRYQIGQDAERQIGFQFAVEQDVFAWNARREFGWNPSFPLTSEYARRSRKLVAGLNSFNTHDLKGENSRGSLLLLPPSYFWDWCVDCFERFWLMCGSSKEPGLDNSSRWSCSFGPVFQATLQACGSIALLMNHFGRCRVSKKMVDMIHRNLDTVFFGAWGLCLTFCATVLGRGTVSQYEGPVEKDHMI